MTTFIWALIGVAVVFTIVVIRREIANAEREDETSRIHPSPHYSGRDPRKK